MASEVAVENQVFINSKYLEIIKKKIVVFDGAMGTSLQSLTLTAQEFGGEKTNGCNDYLILSYPQAVETVHRSFLEVGVDVLETNTFRANHITLAEYGLEDKVLEINRKAAQLARQLADEYTQKTGQERLVAGSIGPTGKLISMNDPELSNITFDQLTEVFREQAAGLIQGGVDLILIETSQDILEVKAAIQGILQAFEENQVTLPIQAQVTLDTTGRMLLGTDVGAILAILEGFPISALGLNCSTGPDYMRQPIQFLGEQSTLPISCIPNAGLPLNVDGQAVYPLEPEPCAQTLIEYVTKYNINIVGGCCGTTPAHLKCLVEGLKNIPPNNRPPSSSPRLASATLSAAMIQQPPPFLIGERLNTQGSRKFKEMILAEDYDNILEIARHQVENGAHGLDICVALTERADEAETMRKVIKTLSPVVSTPFVIDSTEPEVMEVALKYAPGRCLLNSTNLESGRGKTDRILSLAKKYNAAVIVLTIDEQGMAKTAARKLEIAKRIFDIAVLDHGLKPHDLVFDALTFTLATGDSEFNQSAQETLDGISLIKQELPGVLTSLGVSNVSFGLSPAARSVLNSAMLFHAVQAGLDMAIVNPAQITPYLDIPENERILAEDLIYNRREDSLQNFIEHFEKTGNNLKEKASEAQIILSSASAPERVHWRIVHRQKENIEKDIDEIIDQSTDLSKHNAAIKVLNEVLLPAMKEVGDKFGSGELILPFVLQSAEVMKRAVSHVEKYLERQEGISKGTIVLATVYGDVHDIGKNLVKTILSNNGYNVIDLGKQVPAETILAQAVDVKADAIGLSALLVSTSKQMPLIVNELHRRRIELPVLIGGAAINKRFGRRILRTETGEFYEPGVFYCKDAFEGLETIETLMDDSASRGFLEQIKKEAELELSRSSTSEENVQTTGARSNVPPAETIPAPPAWGVKVVRQMPLEIVFQFLPLNELFRLSWGGKNTHGEAWERLRHDFEHRLEEMQQQAIHHQWLKPQGVYGYFPAQAQGNDLIIYDPASFNGDSSVEMARMSFPRQNSGEMLCLADYFSDAESGKFDVVTFQVVTVGSTAAELVEKLQAEGNYSEAYFLHGLAVQTAEATAEYLHRHIRRELGLAEEQGKRYSWGYPAIPDLEDHKLVFQLLPAEKELGMQLTSACQLIPEQSTAAIILHHPQAKYYNTGENRIDQLLK
ncbi:MAG: methionine synthase [Anaerolineaceae bacterium]|nr:methionine synthase [Anaerolineaceae bacterium]